MTEPNDPQDKTPGDELREGLTHFFAAARKVMKNAEPHVAKPLEDAERLLGKLGRGGEALANEVGKEVATLANRVAVLVKKAADRGDEVPPPADKPTEPEQKP